jgi:hemerythrin-like domain-containing protein
MHVEYVRNINRQLVSEENTLLWLARRNLKVETENEIITTQDQVLQINIM